MSPLPLLLQVLRRPARIAGMAPAHWDLLIRQARAAGLLARLYLDWKDADLLTAVPAQVLRHLESERLRAEAYQRAVRWEIRLLQPVFEELEIPLLSLKGAAYVQAGDAAARGRIFNDIDLLVPETALARLERRLLLEGWKPSHLNAYDQRYYRRWMHEIPPLRHVRRQAVLDIHHTLFPRVGRYRLEIATFWRRAVRLRDGTWVLAPEDRVLHSVIHLFTGGEFEHGLRDLTDIRLLLRQFGDDRDFMGRLQARAVALGVVPLLRCALVCSADMLEGTEAAAGLLESAFRLALEPCHTSCTRLPVRLARGALYVRSHWLRMPLRLLIPHLLHKAVVRA